MGENWVTYSIFVQISLSAQGNRPGSAMCVPEGHQEGTHFDRHTFPGKLWEKCVFQSPAHQNPTSTLPADRSSQGLVPCSMTFCFPPVIIVLHDSAICGKGLTDSVCSVEVLL